MATTLSIKLVQFIQIKFLYFLLHPIEPTKMQSIIFYLD